MMNYYDLTIPFCSMIILGLFIELCLSGCLVTLTFRKRKKIPKILTILGMVASGLMVVIYTAEARANLRGLEVPEISDWLCSQPVILPLVVLILVLINFVWSFVCEYKFRNNVISRSSIKEGVDKLNTGLCFYKPGGRMILVNKCMNDLCFAILGHDLQNSEVFWERLIGGEVNADVERISYGSRPDFRLPDGSVWSFAREELDSIYQLTAANTTRIQALMDELKEKNIKLAELNLRLRKHGENVDELTRSKERLEIKARIHGEMGQALLSARRYLLDENDEQIPLLDMWQRNIAMLRKEAELQEDDDPLEMISRISELAGIKVEQNGNLPKSREVQKLFVQATAEALTNAVSHAHATKLYIDLTENDDIVTVIFRNDGLEPNGEIVEGGGLTSLRRRIEGEGGTMFVSVEPTFTLTIVIPKKRGDNL